MSEKIFSHCFRSVLLVSSWADVFLVCFTITLGRDGLFLSFSTDHYQCDSTHYVSLTVGDGLIFTTSFFLFREPSDSACSSFSIVGKLTALVR